MTSVIAGQGSPAYVAAMPAVLLRLFTLLALALMPFGMASSPALAAGVPAATTGHCDEHQKPDAPAKMEMHCASCAALPSVETAEDDPDLRPELPRHLQAMNALPGTEPEIATPPPRPS
jgi:hypothetical protein